MSTPAYPTADPAHAGLSRTRRLTVALALNLALVVTQVIFGLVANSMGLLADAGHNLVDGLAVIGALVAVRFARRAPTERRTFGFHRATVLAAQANALGILVLTGVVVYESLRRLVHPHHVHGGVVAAVALGGAVINLVGAWFLHEGDGHRDLNMRSAMWHMAGDGAASLGVAAAGAVIAVTDGWQWLDPAASIAISALIMGQGWHLLRESNDVLLESTPRGVDPAEVAAALEAVDGVQSVHDLHVWSLASEVRALSAHLVVDGSPSLEAAQAVSNHAKAAVRERFAIAHATLELEHGSCSDDGSWCNLHE